MFNLYRKRNLVMYFVTLYDRFVQSNIVFIVIKLYFHQIDCARMVCLVSSPFREIAAGVAVIKAQIIEETMRSAVDQNAEYT